MSGWPAPSSAVPRRQNGALKGCMASLPQVFQWSRVLGSNNKCIVIPADVQIPSVEIEKQMRIKGQTKQLKLHKDGLGSLAPAVSNNSAIGSSSAWKISDSNVSRETVGMDLRQVLCAKQEPFVLQDVINEKRHPTRTASSRELKFEPAPTRRSTKTKEDRTTSKHQAQAAGNGHAAECQSQFCGGAPKSPATGPVAIVRRSRFPVESMVAMPSYQTTSVGGGHSATKAHSKVASLGRNPVKSPNKRALLMEAAARILEGSMNRGTSKRLSASVRSLLEDLDKSKHVKEPLKPMKKQLATVALHLESTKGEVNLPSVVIPEERGAGSTRHQSSHHLKCVNKHNSKSSCRSCLEKSQVGEGLLSMQKRVLPQDNALDEAEALPSLAVPSQNPSSERMIEYVQLHDGLCSGMKGIEKETVNQNVDGFKWNSSIALPSTNMLLSEVTLVEDQCLEHDSNLHVKESRAIVPSTSIDSPAKSFPIVLINICLPDLEYRMQSWIGSVLDGSSAMHSTWGSHSVAAPFPVDSIVNGEASSPRTTGHSQNEGADETEYSDILREKFVEAEMQSSIMQLRLCNYSWWASDQNKSPKNQLSTDYYAGCDSPVADTCPCFGQMWSKETTEEEASSHECSSEQFQQASPVSVLEPVYEEEELELTDSFNNFEETRQKLLEKVRRYEMLAQMDVDTLKKVSEEQMSYAWEDHESWEADYIYSCSSSNSSSQASPAHHFSSSKMEIQVSNKLFMREPHVFSPDDQSGYEQEVKMRLTASLLDCSAERLEPRLSNCTVLHPQRIVNGDEHIEEVAGTHGRSIAACRVNGLLQKDLAMNKWSSSTQEVEEVELELESSFFDVLMWELLSDLLKAQFKPSCNAFDHPEHPVHSSELSNILPITT